MKLKLKELLKKKGLTAEQAVEKYNKITGETIDVHKFYRWGRGEKEMRLYQVNALAKVLDCKIYSDIVDRKAHAEERYKETKKRLGL